MLLNLIAFWSLHKKNPTMNEKIRSLDGKIPLKLSKIHKNPIYIALTQKHALL